MKKFPVQKNTGFTLIETMVAISIFTASVIGLIVVLSSGITDTTYAKQKITAGYLAQEGIEYMRNMRDTFVLYSSTPQDGWNGFNTKLTTDNNAHCDFNNGCYFDAPNLFSGGPMFMTEISMIPCSGNCATLLYLPATGEYQYDSPGVNSGFIRKISIQQVNVDETRIFSTVYWRQNSGTYSVTLSEDLFNWVE